MFVVDGRVIVMFVDAFIGIIGDDALDVDRLVAPVIVDVVPS